MPALTPLLVPSAAAPSRAPPGGPPPQRALGGLGGEVPAPRDGRGRTAGAPATVSYSPVVTGPRARRAALTSSRPCPASTAACHWRDSVASSGSLSSPAALIARSTSL